MSCLLKATPTLQDDAAQVYLDKGYTVEGRTPDNNALILVNYDKWVDVDDTTVKDAMTRVSFSRPYVLIDVKGRVIETTYYHYDKSLTHKGV